MSWLRDQRRRLAEWAFNMHETELLGLELFWFWHSRHSCAFGFRRPKTGRFVRLGNNGHGDEWREPCVEVTFRTSRPGRAGNRIRNP
jgi:hypothetical protein